MANTYATRASARMELAARGLFAAHVALILFSTVAMLTIVNRPPGPWLSQEPAATVMRVAWSYSGPLYVTLGALTAMAALAARLGGARAVALFAIAIAISLGAELLGTTVGLPFGEYHYSSLLGYRIAGRVPFPIPLSWFYMLAGSLVAVARRPWPNEHRNPWRWATLAAVMLVAWDISMDPAMVHTGHWSWGAGDAFRRSGLPGFVVTFFTRPSFYGMPFSNWLGWFLTAMVIARVLLTIVPPADVEKRLAPSRLLVLLYLVNGIMPVALCIRDRLWVAAGLGGVAMAAVALPALWPLRHDARAGASVRQPQPPLAA